MRGPRHIKRRVPENRIFRFYGFTYSVEVFRACRINGVLKLDFGLT